jgi:hypothetical protein
VPRLSKLRSRNAIELAICYALILLVIWTPRPTQRFVFWIAFAWILVTTLVCHPDADTLGPAALQPAKLALDHDWGSPFRRSTCWVCIRVTYAASAPRRRVSWIARGRLSTLGVRATVHLAGLFSAPTAAYLAQPIRGDDYCCSAVFDRTPSQPGAHGGNSRLGNRLVYPLPSLSQSLCSDTSMASWASASRFQCRMRSLTT